MAELRARDDANPGAGHVSAPRASENVNGYLAALNAALAVGMRSRSRILEEAGEHLYQAASAEHERLVAQTGLRELPAQLVEEVWTTAQRRAIASFGTPEEVAAGFGTRPLGSVDRRLALADGRFEAVLRRRPVLAGTIWAAATSLAWVAIGVAICVVGGLFHVGYAVNVLPSLALFSVTFFCVRMWLVLRRLPAGGAATWRGLPLGRLAHLGLIALRDVLGCIFFMGYVLLTDPMSFIGLTAAWFGLALVVELAARLARRTGHAGGWSAYGSDPDENWSRYVHGLWTSAGITLA
ncbi:MAG: hypothetical protein H0W96_17045, partial [Solirubrobacterales bacterium]|nr:hypothetical protein [Solirubrobacterales bacterium]